MSTQRSGHHEKWTEDPRYRVSNREAVIAAVFFLAYIVVTIGTAWLIGGGKDVDEIGLVLGFPDWFFWSTLVLGTAFCLVPYVLVSLFFTHMPLDADAEWPDDGTPAGAAQHTGREA